jgi:orotidine-5'-phosphate decarboxylase
MTPRIPEIVIALDFPDMAAALALADRLRGRARWLKVGLELYAAAGPEVVSRLRGMGFRVFVDLKIFDIPNTAAGAVRSLAGAGADMLTLHAMGGRRMLEAAADAADMAHTRPILLAVTVLTSWDRDDMAVLGLAEADPGRLVLDLAKKGVEYGADGVVCSGLEAGDIRQGMGPGPVILTPGIRLAEAGDDQRRVVTPDRAVRDGANFLVVGRPVTRAHDPLEAYARHVEAMGDAGKTPQGGESR